jgi:hypothetical protein
MLVWKIISEEHDFGFRGERIGNDDWGGIRSRVGRGE